MNRQFRFVLTLAAVVGLVAAASAQVPITNDIGNIGPSGAQVAGVIAGVTAVTRLILYFTVCKPAIARPHTASKPTCRSTLA